MSGSIAKGRAGALAPAAIRSRQGRAIAALALGIAALLALFLPESRAAVDIWSTSTAYGHCFLVLPMTVYLLWERRELITASLPRPEPAWAVLGLPVALVWFVAERLGIMEGRQLAAIAGLEVLFLTVLGWRMFFALSGPLAFLLFLVPFGAFLTPLLQRFTADFTIDGLNLLGIPNFSDKFTIETPAGVFFVAEACAGLRFLIAAVAFGVFYALLTYRTTSRRLVFMAASVVVPIIANGFRALGIVVLGQILGSAEAAAADHVLYGWIFFSIVMLLLVLGGLPLREHGPAPAVAPPADLRPAPSPIWGMLVAVLLVGAGPAAAALFEAGSAPASLRAAPEFRVPTGCSRVGAADNFHFAMKCGGYTYDVDVEAFAVRSSPSTAALARRRVTQEIGAEDVLVAPLGADPTDGDWQLMQTSEPNRSSAFAIWVDGVPVSAGLAGRLEQARSSMLGAQHVPVLITISTPEPERSATNQRRAVVAQLRAIVDAQPDLTDQIERLSRLR